MKRVVQLTLLSLLLSPIAFAHGQQILGLPLGQMAAMFVVLLVALLLRITWRGRVIVVLSALGAAFATWFIPAGGFIGRHFGYGMSPWFVLGIAPPLLFGAGMSTYILVRRLSSRTNREKA